MKGCLACDLADGRVLLPGGAIHETEHWAGRALRRAHGPRLQVAMFADGATPPSGEVEELAELARAAFHGSPA